MFHAQLAGDLDGAVGALNDDGRVNAVQTPLQLVPQQHVVRARRVLPQAQLTGLQIRRRQGVQPQHRELARGRVDVPAAELPVQCQQQADGVGHARAVHAELPHHAVPRQDSQRVVAGDVVVGQVRRADGAEVAVVAGDVGARRRQVEGVFQDVDDDLARRPLAAVLAGRVLAARALVAGVAAPVPDVEAPPVDAHGLVLQAEPLALGDVGHALAVHAAGADLRDVAPEAHRAVRLLDAHLVPEADACRWRIVPARVLEHGLPGPHERGPDAADRQVRVQHVADVEPNVHPTTSPQRH